MKDWPPKIPDVKDIRKSPFHDSFLIDIEINSFLTRISVVVSTPEKDHSERLWLIECTGVLRLEYQTVGNGFDESGTPIEIYEIYDDRESEERRWWVNQLKLQGISPAEAEKVHHIVLASSFICGIEKREYLDGIHIICREARVNYAPGKYRLHPPWLPAGGE